ncbi:MAG: site-2 protease family protein [Phycisphaerales bacterium]|nr:site-2 protease family protein [Phycisphaerales bacterium]
MSGWWASDLMAESPVLLVSWVAWVVCSIILHELGHGLAAIRCGDRTPIETGHMTLNPMVHMGPMSLLMFAIIGIAWGTMPVNPYRFRGRHADAFVAAAGPAVNLCLFVICAVAAAVIAAVVDLDKSPTLSAVGDFFYLGAKLNIVLLIFNLLPIPPLDGSRIIMSLSHRARAVLSDPRSGNWVMAAFFVLFIFGGRAIWPVADTVTRSVIVFLLRIIT